MSEQHELKNGNLIEYRLTEMSGKIDSLQKDFTGIRESLTIITTKMGGPDSNFLFQCPLHQEKLNTLEHKVSIVEKVLSDKTEALIKAAQTEVRVDKLEIKLDEVRSSVIKWTGGLVVVTFIIGHFIAPIIIDLFKTKTTSPPAKISYSVPNKTAPFYSLSP